MPAPQQVDKRVVRLTLDPVIATVVVCVSVAVIFAVCLVVSVFIADRIEQREAIVYRDEIDAREWQPSGRFEQVGGAVDAAC